MLSGAHTRRPGRLIASATPRKVPTGTQTIHPPWGGQWRHCRHTSHKNRVEPQQQASHDYGPAALQPDNVTESHRNTPEYGLKRADSLRDAYEHGTHCRDLLRVTAYWHEARSPWPCAQGVATALHSRTGSGGACIHSGVAQGCHTQHTALAGMLADGVVVYRGATRKRSAAARIATCRRNARPPPAQRQRKAARLG